MCYMEFRLKIVVNEYHHHHHHILIIIIIIIVVVICICSSGFVCFGRLQASTVRMYFKIQSKGGLKGL